MSKANQNHGIWMSTVHNNNNIIILNIIGSHQVTKWMLIYGCNNLHGRCRQGRERGIQVQVSCSTVGPLLLLKWPLFRLFHRSQFCIFGILSCKKLAGKIEKTIKRKRSTNSHTTVQPCFRHLLIVSWGAVQKV